MSTFSTLSDARFPDEPKKRPFFITLARPGTAEPPPETSAVDLHQVGPVDSIQWRRLFRRLQHILSPPFLKERPCNHTSP
jgi:hypothetical protein